MRQGRNRKNPRSDARPRNFPIAAPIADAADQRPTARSEPTLVRNKRSGDDLRSVAHCTVRAPEPPPMPHPFAAAGADLTVGRWNRFVDGVQEVKVSDGTLLWSG